MKVPFFDYKGYCKDIDYKKLLNQVLETGFLIGGPFVDEVENKIQNLTNIKNCVCLGNATDAMEIIFDFLKLPINSKVIVPAHTMLATASAAKTAGLLPVPLDVDPKTYMLEIDQLRNCNLTDVSAIMITQLNGVVADMNPIKEFCVQNNLALIEDSAQGIGSFNNDKHAGSWGVGGCLSFYPAKIIGCLGDGGALITNDNKLADFARSVRDQGRGKELEAINWGRNSRLDSLNARVILERLNQLKDLIQKRREIADVYYKNLQNLEEKGFISLPPKFSTNSNSRSTYQNFEIRAQSRDQLINFLKKKDISTIKQWGGFSIAHFSKLGFNIKNFPATKELFNDLMLLPLNHLMNVKDAKYVCNCVLNFYKN